MIGELTRGTVEWDGRKITVEGPASFVADELAKFRGARTEHQESAPASARTGRPMNDAGFVALKKPADHFEKIAVLAVRLQEQGKAVFDGDEMRRAYLRAGIKPPKVINQALVDTKRKRDYIEPTSTRGEYRLTSHGSDFVRFDLPRSEG